MVFLVQLFRVPVLRVQTEGSGVFLIPQKRPECRAEGQIYRVSIRSVLYGMQILKSSIEIG